MRVTERIQRMRSAGRDTLRLLTRGSSDLKAVRHDVDRLTTQLASLGPLEQVVQQQQALLQRQQVVLHHQDDLRSRLSSVQTLIEQLGARIGDRPAPQQRPLGARGTTEPLERRRHARELCMQGSTALLKGDTGLATMLFWQANVYDPRSEEPEARLREAAAVAGQLTDREPDAAGRKFDFLYAPTLRGLSSELSSLVPLHPQLVAVPKSELDVAIERGAEEALLAKYRRAVLERRPDIKCGLIQHAFIANQLSGPEVATRLAAVTTRALFLHGVREPLGLAVSTYNHCFIARHGGAFKFHPVDPQTLFGRAAFELEGWKRRPMVLAAQDRVPLSLDPSMAEALLDEAVSRPRHFAVGEGYGRHFDAWVPINLASPVPPTRHVVQQIFAAVGVGTEMDHPALYASENTDIHRLMVQNYIELRCFNHTLHLGLGFADRAMFSNTYPYHELFAFQADDRFDGTELSGQALCITVPAEQWRLLPREARIRLIESEELVEFCDLVLIPAWLQSHAVWTARVRPLLLRGDEPGIAPKLKTQIGKDFEQFVARHPQFEQLWPDAVAALGR
jgi:hypothetical protein